MSGSKIGSERECIHLFSPGRSIDKTFVSVSKKYRVDKIYVFVEEHRHKRENEKSSEILSAVQRLIERASILEIPVKTIRVDENNVGQIRDKVLSIRESYPDSSLYFNITGGKKVLSLYMFMMAVWINGSAYYVEEKNDDILEFSIPRIRPDNIDITGGNFQVLEVIYSLCGGNVKPVLYADAFIEFSRKYRPRRKNDAGRYPSASKGTFSKFVRHLIEDGLIVEEYSGLSRKKKILSLTSEGIFTVSFVANSISSKK